MECLPFSSFGTPVHAFVAGRQEEFGHLAWYVKQVETYREENLQHVNPRTYLDYAGAALYSRAQILAASAALLENFFANPHTTPATIDVITQIRGQVLELFGASPKTHTLIFCAGSTHALQLLGESYPWSEGGIFVYAKESHTSVLGLRQYAQCAKTDCGTFCLQDLPLLSNGLSAAEPLLGTSCSSPLWKDSRMVNGPKLLALPGESNFSGVRGNLSCINALRSGPLKWRVLLDAAKLACSPGALDLAACGADFTVVSFYKIFGYPTGLGALIVRHDAVPLLVPAATLGESGPSHHSGPAYFGGGCVSAISATSNFAVPRPELTQWLERGTSHFQGIIALPSQIAAARALGPDVVRRRHALAVCREAYLSMKKLHHRTGQPLCTIFGNHAHSQWHLFQGPTVACVLHLPDGSPLPCGIVDERARARNIIIRTGCLCNVGACQEYLGITDADIRIFFASGKVCGDDVGVIDGRPVGVVRISFGLFSTLEDVHRWISLLEEEFIDCLPETMSTFVCASVCELPHTSQVLEGKGLLDASNQQRLFSQQSSSNPMFSNLHISAADSHVQASPKTTTEGTRTPIENCAGSEGEIVGLKVYPIKGCGPLCVKRWPLDPATGALFLDRRWCVAHGEQHSRASAHLRPVSAKQAPRLTQVRLTLGYIRMEGEVQQLCLVLTSKADIPKLVLPISQGDVNILRQTEAETSEPVCTLDGSQYVIADHALEAQRSKASQWFDAILGISSLNLVEAGMSAGTGEVPSSTHFANAPSTLLLVSTASLKEFGRVCGLSAPANRFRANLEVKFDVPFAEDRWAVGDSIALGDAEFEAAGRCVRCQAVDVDPDSGAAQGPSLLAALATSQQGSSKGPTFGVLLRYRTDANGDMLGGSTPLMLSIGMQVHAPTIHTMR